ncbi:hypothetical protein, partial [Hypericibacter sp.]|uniref:hypothetical protein n=1 Tax=Hypericibacter sp. TaxID=2705401 RepID=UPI003D6D96D9
KDPLKLSLPSRMAGKTAAGALAEVERTGHFIQLLASFIVCPTRERMARFMTALEDYQAEWISRRSGEPK